MYNSTTSPKTSGSNGQDIPTRAPSTNVPENYYSELPVRFGVLFGVLGSLLIMALSRLHPNNLCGNGSR